MKPELLLSLPPNMCNSLADCDPELAARCFATYDPPDAQLGSGGGTAYLLEQAWRDAERVGAFEDWLGERSKLLIHSGGESRRLPSYAASGKLFLPVPALRWKYGQRLDQNLLDMQEPFLERVAAAATGSRVIVASGDVLLEGAVESLPDADVVLLGMWTTPEDAEHFGVFFCDQQEPGKLVTFLQKPAPEKTRELSRSHLFMVDVGVWVLSEKAVACLMEKCGWQPERSGFEGGLPENYDLYGEWALHLGSNPEVWDAAVSELTVAVVAVDDGEFYHFGRSSDIMDSSYRLQNKVMNQTQLGAVPSLGQPKQFVLNAAFNARRGAETRSYWIENCCIPESWSLACRNVVTNVPENSWTVALGEEQCLDMAPVGERHYALRCYGFNDAFRGRIGDSGTVYLGASVGEWLERRGLSFAEAGLEPEQDLQVAALFPRLELSELSGALIQWILAADPAPNEALKRVWVHATRLSAREISQQANLRRLVAQRQAFCRRILPVMIRHGANSLFYKLDISRSARDYAQTDWNLVPEEEIFWRGDRMLPVHDQIFRSAVCRERGKKTEAEAFRAEAFKRLRKLLVEPVQAEKVVPRLTVLEDQIVWARSPVRIDFAGGWSDTPPYCLEHGGAVFNVAVDLNGQPPIQVFVRPTKELTLSIRSIDLGLTETLRSYEDVGAYGQLGSGFSIARAAFALVGFHPEFGGARYSCLEDQLSAFGGGIEVSLLAAVPKGSGLGTSSILAGTLLGGLADFCGLGWDCMKMARRVSALEQMLGSGGGWQDQYGGLLQGAKLVATAPGFSQDAVVRWSAAEFFDAAIRDGRLLLYYTGLTRVAHDVLGEIVCNMFLNRSDVLVALEQIGENGTEAMERVQRGDWAGFVEVVRTSWRLNQALDAGVNPPAVKALVAQLEGCYAALKLTGAGGGGYMVILTDSHEQSQALQQRLVENPPNDRARFVELEISRSGLQISRS